MLGLQGNASSSKEYRCVACSDTFTGLASLLVHQATHATSLPDPTQSCFESTLSEASSFIVSSTDIEPSLPKILSSPMNACDSGEKDITATVPHKQSHPLEEQSPQTVNHESTKEEVLSSIHGDSTAAPTHMALAEDPTAGSCVDEVQEENVACPEDQVSEPAEPNEQCDNSSDKNNHMDKTVPTQMPFMKSLISENGKHSLSLPSEDNDSTISLKEEPEVTAITPHTKETSNTTKIAKPQLKRIRGKAGVKTKAPSISRLLESSTKKIVSLTKIFSPVVVLETRQRFMEPSGDGYGKYQCSRCRRVFQDVDSLTDHHFMHKLERIKCCRHCKQLIIGKVPLPDNHACPLSGGKVTVSSLSFKQAPTNKQKTVQFNPKKIYFCPICKRNFARRNYLKMHKCSVLNQSKKIKPFHNEACTPYGGETSRSIGVSTKVRSIKVEDDSESHLFDVTQASLSTFEQVQNSQWTAPLSNEMVVHPKMNKNASAKGRRLHFSTTPRDEVRRYKCDKCQKTFGLSGNLSRHKKVCSVRPTALGSRHSPFNADPRVFSCYICGTSFNRKDNMLAHRKKCEQGRTVSPSLAYDMNLGRPSNPAPGQTEEEDGDSWSLMSLPSVLPRRVTCECGVGFTSPKLLLEHLQKHAQESYICPTCGLKVRSWADYEVHLQLHVHPQILKRSQPILIRLKQSLSEPACSPGADDPAQPAPPAQNRLKGLTRKQPFACPKCGNSFASRCTLRRHLTWSQCRGGGANISINHNLFSIN